MVETEMREYYMDIYGDIVRPPRESEEDFYESVEEDQQEPKFEALKCQPKKSKPSWIEQKQSKCSVVSITLLILSLIVAAVFILMEKIILHKVVDGKWSDWMNGSCSVSCGTGRLTRFRQCERPLNGGLNCTGEYVIDVECNKVPCSVCQFGPYNKSSGERVCFIRLADNLDWYSSKSSCEAQNSRLPEVGSAQDNNLLLSLKPPTTNFNDGVWLGLNDIDSEGNFVWSSNGGAPKYTNWYNKEPNNHGGKENCVTILTNGFWNDGDCTNGLGQRTLCELVL